MLKVKFTKLCNNFSNDKELISKLWQETEEAYSQKNRHYHTLKHLEHIYNELLKYVTFGLSYRVR